MDVNHFMRNYKGAVKISDGICAFLCNCQGFHKWPKSHAVGNFMCLLFSKHLLASHWMNNI